MRPAGLTLRERMTGGGQTARRFLHGAGHSIPLESLVSGSGFGDRLPELAGRSVLIATHDQLAAAIAMIELDGVARRMVILPPDVPDDHIRVICDRAGIDAIVNEAGRPPRHVRSGALAAEVTPPVPAGSLPAAALPTEWVLLTSGTSGVPKLAVHSQVSLTAPVHPGQHAGAGVVWGTYYDIRRYGGMQIFFRALLGQGSLVLSAADESPGNHLLRLARHGVTHLTGTPSHWRRALMSPAIRNIAPRYARLSGEVADQGILDALHTAFPDAAVGHAFASTEAGVAFEVTDGQAGFPLAFLERTDVAMKIVDGSLRIRSSRTATHYLGDGEPALRDADGFVDTGDMIEVRSERCRFLGRRTGIINVGGMKVHPEEVEAVINTHPAVRMSCVRAKRSPITGALVVADVVLHDPSAAADAGVRSEILDLCRARLARHKVPTTLAIVPQLAVAASGKIARTA